MVDKHQLMLHEEVMLLALRDEEGTIEPGTMYQYAIGGAVLAELMLQGRIEVEESRRKKVAKVVNPSPTGAPLLDECLDRMRDSKPKPLAHWVAKFAGITSLKHRVAQRLCDSGILREDEGRILLVFSRKVYPESDPRPEREIVERLRGAIFTDAGDIDARTAVLLSLADKGQLLKATFDKKDLKARKDRIERVVNGELTGKAANEAIEAMQAAVMVAAIIPIIVTTSH